MPNRIIHIGYPKTGTTFLQWEIFPNLSGLSYVDYKKCRELFADLVYSDPLDYPMDLLKARMKESRGENQLFSFESLAGSPFYYKGMGRSGIPYVLKELGFSKVIITVRDQVKAIDSYYRQYVVQGGTLSFKKWLDFDNYRPLANKYFQLGYLKYDGLIERYFQLFGKENVLVLDQSDLLINSEVTIDSIATFTHSQYVNGQSGKAANKSMTNLSITLLRFFNHFTFSSIRPFHLFSDRISNRPIWKLFAVIIDPYFIRFFSKRKMYVSPNLESRIRLFYEESNSRLAALASIHFKKQ